MIYVQYASARFESSTLRDAILKRIIADDGLLFGNCTVTLGRLASDVPSPCFGSDNETRPVNCYSYSQIVAVDGPAETGKLVGRLLQDLHAVRERVDGRRRHGED